MRKYNLESNPEFARNQYLASKIHNAAWTKRPCDQNDNISKGHHWNKFELQIMSSSSDLSFIFILHPQKDMIFNWFVFFDTNAYILYLFRYLWFIELDLRGELPFLK